MLLISYSLGGALCFGQLRRCSMEAVFQLLLSLLSSMVSSDNLHGYPKVASVHILLEQM